MRNLTENKLFIFLILIALTLTGGFFRFYKNTKNPVSLTIDEVAFGYNAYSILKTGKDEYGVFLPLSFKSTGDYKNPIPIYSMVPFIKLFGLNEFSIRLPTALIATLSIPVFYLFFVEFIESSAIALGATFLLTISIWHIYYSRYVSDHLMATFLIVLGMFCFLKTLKTNRWFWPILSAIFFVLSMYTYYAPRLFVPLFIFSLLFFKRSIIKVKLKYIVIFVITSLLLVTPLAYSTFFGPDRARAQMTFITGDVEFQRSGAIAPAKIYPILSQLDSNNILIFFYWARKYLNYFQPSFLFYSGLNMTTPGSFGLGVLYLFELPFLILGIIAILTKKIPNKELIFSWLLIGLFPASLTNNEQHPGRTFFILPMLLIISSIGAIKFFELVSKYFSSKLKIIIFTFFSIFFIWNLIQALIIYTVHFPKQKSEDFMDGTKKTVEYALENKYKYKEIVFDPYRGIEAPYIVSIPHMYILFYSQYDPLTYQTENKYRSDGSFGFDKFTIRQIDWRQDRLKKDTLFIGSPWSLPEKDLKDIEILKRVYLNNGNLAFIIVNPK